MATSASQALRTPFLKTPSLSSKQPLTSAFSVALGQSRRAVKPLVVVVSATAGGLDGKPTVLVAEKLGEAGLELLKEFANVDCAYNLSPEELCTKISLCDALIVRSGTKVSREVFESSGGRLKVVGRAGVGIDNVDLAAATEHGCLVVNAPTANTVAAAEHGIALLAAMARNVAQADASVKDGKWQRNKYVGVSLVGKTLAVMGFGKVGTEVARRAKGLGMHVIAHDPYAPADRARAIGVELVSFDEAIATADFISLHMPLTPATSKVLNDETFAKMKKGVRIVNVARGGVIDEEALVRALDAGIVAQAALDVFTQEPPSKDSKLIQHERVTATPHLGASTMEAQEGVAIEIAEAVVGALKGELAATAVNAPMVPAEVLTELKPYVVLAEKLGRLAVQLVAGGSGVKTVKVTYASARATDDLDTRLLRAMITKGIIEPISSVFINLVNADFTAKQRGLRITEERIGLDGSPENPLDFIQVQIANVESKFASAISDSGEIKQNSLSISLSIYRDRTTMSTPSLDEETAKKVLRQVEFYFSDSNLPRDNFLKKTISECEDGLVDLALICSFTRMRNHLNLGNVKPDEVPEDSVKAVAETLKKSTSLKVSEDGTKVGRTTELPKPEIVIEQLDIRTIAASPFEYDVTQENMENFFGQFSKINSVRLPRHVGDKRFFCGTALIEFSTEEEAEKVLKQSLVYGGVTLELKPKRDFDIDRARETEEYEKSHSARGSNRKNNSNAEPNYPKGLIIAFTLKSMSDGGSTEQNGTNDTANDDKIVCKTEGGLDSSENETRETEKTVVKNVNEDEETPGENIEKDNKENVDRNGLESEEKETEGIEKSPEGPTEMSDEKEEKRTAASYMDDMNVVLREDLKGVFQKYGTVKFIDFKIGAASGYIRFEEPEAAQKARAAAVLSEQGGVLVKNYIAILEPVTGEAEKEYWSLLRGNQDKYRENKGGRGRGGKYNRGGKHSRSREHDTGRGRPNKAQKVEAA